MMEAVHHYEGTVNQVMGDGIMALFGAPIAHEDHAVRACYAALRMQESVARYADEARRVHGGTVQIRVGLNSGEVVVGAIGNDLRMDYTAVGETTHLAARMEQAARPGTVLIAPATLALVEGFVAVTPLGPVPVKGLREPVEVYELSGIGPARTRLQAAARRGLTQFVGRDAEIEVLRRSLEQAGAGHGQVVAIVGEAGVGKSRLHWVSLAKTAPDSVDDVPGSRDSQERQETVGSGSKAGQSAAWVIGPHGRSWSSGWAVSGRRCRVSRAGGAGLAG